HTPGLDARVDAEVALAGAHVPAIAFGAVTRDREVIASAVGHADVAAQVRATADTPFEAASIAKTVIATCVLQLVAAHILELHADASRCVGSPLRHPKSRTPITLRMLLSHTSSIRDRPEETLSRGGIPLGEFLRAYFSADGGARRDTFFDGAPGTMMAYSN